MESIRGGRLVHTVAGGGGGGGGGGHAKNEVGGLSHYHHGTAPSRMMMRTMRSSSARTASSSSSTSRSTSTLSTSKRNAHSNNEKDSGNISNSGRLTPTTDVPPRYFINLKETVLQRYRALGYLSENKFRKLQRQNDLPVRLAGGESRKVTWLVDPKDLSLEEGAELLGLLVEGAWDRTETNRAMASKAFAELLPVASKSGALMEALVPPEPTHGFRQLPVPEVVKQLSRGMNTFQPSLIGLMLVLFRQLLDAHRDVANCLMPFYRKLLPVLGIYIYSNIVVEIPPRGTLLPVNKVVSVSGYGARDAGKGQLQKRAWGLKGKQPVPLGCIPTMAKKERLTKLIEDVLDRIIKNASDRLEATKIVKLNIPTYAGV